MRKRTPKELYVNQEGQARDRGIEWLFTYEEWLEMWLVSGRWLERGKHEGEYQMCRIGDEGPYSKRNCYIATMEDNQKVRRKYSDETAQEIADLYLNSNMPQHEIGKRYGLHQSTVSKIITGVRRVGT